jgi:protein SCO1
VPSYLVKSVCYDYKKTTNTLFPTIIGFVFLFLSSFQVPGAEHQHAPASDNYDKDKALAFSQAAINRKIDSYTFINTDKQSIDITRYRGKPLIVSLIYTSCHHICPTLTNNLARVVKIAQEALGDDSFSVVSIGFDTAVDSPERMRLYAKERNLDIPNWDFLSTDESTIKTFADDIGFIFFESSKGFDHLSQVTLLDGKGVVYRQIYGVKYEPPMLVEPLKELVFGKHTEATLVEGWVNNVRLFCTIYDPLTGRYEFDYSIFIGIFMGIFILGAIATFIIREWRQNNIKGRT